MKVIVVFESMFGNTKVLAQDVRDGLAEAGAEVALVGVVDATRTEVVDCDLVVLAATDSRTEPEPAADAGRRSQEGRRSRLRVDRDPGVARQARRDAAGDVGASAGAPSSTPGSGRRGTGRAPQRSARRARCGRTASRVVEQMSFYVEGITGPVTSGEHLRARMWGRHLAELVPDPAAS